MSFFLSRNEVNNLQKESLEEFLALRVQEGAYIDYKRKLSGKKKKEAHKEFLKDITAFANANGGLLVLGVKEPSEDQSVDDQIIGLEDGTELAKTLERLAASSVEPRIPGLLVNPVTISDTHAVVAVYIPNSMIKSHMVNYMKDRTFFIRHTESSVPMATHEIRDAVLNSATTQGQARYYADQEEREALEYTIQDRRAFLLQAIPILTITEPWDVLSKPIKKIVSGEDREFIGASLNRFSLRSYITPTPTLKGVIGKQSREDPPLWLTEIHRTGYLQAIYMDIEAKPDDPPLGVLNEVKHLVPQNGVLDDYYKYLFKAFGDLCESLWKVTQTGIPYLFRCKYFNAENTVFTYTKGPQTNWTDECGRRYISWPEQIRQVGEPLEKIHRTWTLHLFHAFGLDWKVPEER